MGLDLVSLACVVASIFSGWVTTYSTLASAVIGSDFDKSSISNSLVRSMHCKNGEFGAIYLVLKRSAVALLIKLLN